MGKNSGRWDLFSFLPMSTIEVFAHSGGDYIAYQELSIACLAVHLTEGYLQGP